MKKVAVGQFFLFYALLWNIQAANFLIPLFGKIEEISEIIF